MIHSVGIPETTQGIGQKLTLRPIKRFAKIGKQAPWIATDPETPSRAIKAERH
jgi:hypothetical protein